jgi:hypothetical protein
MTTTTMTTNSESRTETILKALKEGQICEECKNFEADWIFYYHTESIVSGEKIFLCNGCFGEWYEVLNDEDN